jgi:hypothetical protein
MLQMTAYSHTWEFCCGRQRAIVIVPEAPVGSPLSNQQAGEHSAKKTAQTANPASRKNEGLTGNIAASHGSLPLSKRVPLPQPSAVVHS